ncbi:uncharacterized protein LOC129889069 [Solanum dulcamara]|uniref:uncharacterized protein LOC129889069 n=1 Tax=Solanum dulcamara TaxID=45834 RepID=UPI002485BA59|nr:uncharacterized protein LOC129889069 [Solanum dulcamara]XP_055820161.1 uncharacterized protein LOC129889069 [Solanum dulcamara]XP_055820162.1 uncharacterized protein LOC129889069 [Solanum dulcamara]
MEDNLMNGIVMDLDLNQEPMESSALGLGSLLNDFETAHSRIEQRILQLEAVAARSLHRHRWRQAHNSADDETRNSADTGDVVGNEVQHHNFVGNGKGCKRDRSHLVAKALEMDLVVKKVDKNGGSFFDCNICFDIAKEPILTCCGHLYCWSCFYQLPYVDSTTKECPDCKGEVTDANITPIYGNSNSYCSKEVHCGSELPPRPKANRVESVRQQRVTRGLSHIPVAEALRRIRTSIGLGDHPHQLETGGVSSSSVSGSHELQNTEATGIRRLRSRVFSRVLSESAASLSSELENAQRMIEDLEASLTDRIHERSNSQVSSIGHVAADEGNSPRRDAAIIRSEHQTLDSIAETSSVASFPSSSQSNEVSDAALQLENLTTDSGNLPVSRSPSSSRRRSSFSRLSDLDSELLHETRRRRFN